MAGVSSQSNLARETVLKTTEMREIVEQVMQKHKKIKKTVGLGKTLRV